MQISIGVAAGVSRGLGCWLVFLAPGVSELFCGPGFNGPRSQHCHGRAVDVD